MYTGKCTIWKILKVWNMKHIKHLWHLWALFAWFCMSFQTQKCQGSDLRNLPPKQRFYPQISYRGWSPCFVWGFDLKNDQLTFGVIYYVTSLPQTRICWLWTQLCGHLEFHGVKCLHAVKNECPAMSCSSCPRRLYLFCIFALKTTSGFHIVRSSD